MVWVSIILSRGDVFRVNKIGPGTDPWGTPWEMVCLDDRSFPINSAPGQIGLYPYPPECLPIYSKSQFKRCDKMSCLTLKVPEKLPLYGLYVYCVVHICDFGMLRVNDVKRTSKTWRCFVFPYPCVIMQHTQTREVNRCVSCVWTLPFVPFPFCWACSCTYLECPEDIRSWSHLVDPCIFHRSDTG